MQVRWLVTVGRDAIGVSSGVSSALLPLPAGPDGPGRLHAVQALVCEWAFDVLEAPGMLPERVVVRVPEDLPGALLAGAAATGLHQALAVEGAGERVVLEPAGAQRAVSRRASPRG